MSVRRPPAPSRSSCSRHSSRPAAKRTASAATNCPRRSLPAASSGSARPVAADRSVPRIAPAASLAVRTVRSRSMASTPVDRRARMIARRVALALHRLLAVRRLRARAPQPLGHVVEGVHQKAHLVARGQRQARGEVALADRARALDEVLHRAHQALRGVDRAVDRRQHRQQQHQREREPEAVLERLAHRREVAVLRCRSSAPPRTARRAAPAPGRARPRSARPARRRRAAAPRRCGSSSARRLRLEAHVRQVLLHLAHQIRRRAATAAFSSGFSRLAARMRLVLRRTATISSAWLARRSASSSRLHVGGGVAASEPRERHGARRVLAHAQIERRARQRRAHRSGPASPRP